ncbi:unnamed protein product, partial [Sphacelaria rigidula]
MSCLMSPESRVPSRSTGLVHVFSIYHAEDARGASLLNVDAQRDIELRRVSDLCRPRTVPRGGEHGW